MQRAEIIRHLQATLRPQADLDQVIRALHVLKESGREEAHPPAVPTPAEMQQLLASPDNDRDKLVLRLLYASGMRVGEVAALRRADLLVTEGKLFVRSGKGNVDRYLLVDPLTMERLAAYASSRPLNERLFPAERRLHEIVRDAAHQTGLLEAYLSQGLHLSPHSFRHAYTTHCYDNGMDVYALKKLLGHAYLETTELYLATSCRRVEPLYHGCHELCLTRRKRG